MKAVTISLPQELDERARREAERRGISKSELIRLGLAAVLPSTGGDDAHGSGDPWIDLAGAGSEEITVEPGDIDAAVYGPDLGG